ncbi:hypothetical protein [Georgenia alba]|uniref:Glycosyl hydrolases family 43 n=1 Tax=Georgenia alba TaxID=2233858 RepID=A0ABW2Q8F5_9MICO
MTATIAVAASLTATTAPAATAEVVLDRTTLSEVYDPPPGFYTYAPSVVRDGDTEWIWTCHNDEADAIKDHIYMTKVVDGVVVESRSVLQASPAPAWDSFHVCDPSVISGSFRLDGERYGYAMFYLGNDLDASAHNQIGVAFAKAPEGPWVKYPDPLVTFDRQDQWGVGQPSAVALAPGSGRVMLFYTRGDTSTRAYQRVLDLGDMRTPEVGPPTLLTTDGLVGTDGGPDWLNGYDVALDRDRGRVYTVREQHPYPELNPWWIGEAVQLASMPMANVLSGGGEWSVEADVDQQVTGHPRNHNAGLVRTWHGYLPARERIEIVFTDSCESLPTVEDPDWSQATCDSLFEYDLWSITGTVVDRPGHGQ